MGPHKKRRGARKSETERWLHFESKNTHQLFSSKFCSIFWKNQPKCFKWPWAGKCDEDIFFSVRKELTRLNAKLMKIATTATVAVACSNLIQLVHRLCDVKAAVQCWMASQSLATNVRIFSAKKLGYELGIPVQSESVLTMWTLINISLNETTSDACFEVSCIFYSWLIFPKIIIALIPLNQESVVTVINRILHDWKIKEISVGGKLSGTVGSKMVWVEFQATKTCGSLKTNSAVYSATWLFLFNHS